MSITEIARIQVTDPDAFLRAAAKAKPVFLSAKGCHAFDIERLIETPEIFHLRVVWDSVEDHMVGFRGSDGFATWRALVSPYFAAPPEVVHVHSVTLACA